MPRKGATIDLCVFVSAFTFIISGFGSSACKQEALEKTKVKMMTSVVRNFLMFVSARIQEEETVAMTDAETSRI